jgi:hypothetical protein
VFRDTSTTEDVIFGSSNATNSPRLAFPSGTGTMVFKPNGATGSGVTFTASGIGSTGTWKHIALVFQDSTNTANLFLNGVLAVTGTTSDQFHNIPGNFEVGRSATSPASYFDGKIAEVAVYQTALSAIEIVSHYNSRTKYFSGNVYADQIINSGNYLADAIIKIEGPVYSSTAGGIGIEISNNADESLNLNISAPTNENALAQDIFSISGGNQTTALNITYNNILKIKAPSSTTTVIAENEYLLINTTTRVINKYSGGEATSAYSQLDIDSEWIKFSPGINPIYVNCYGYSRPLITFYYRYTFI